MTDWKTYDFETRIREILLTVKYKANPEHHFGNPFLSAYQIAIEYDRKHSNDVKSMGYLLGGKGIGTKTSLAQYIGRQLSTNIKNGTIKDIEGGFFSNQDLEEIRFDYDGNKIISSATDGIYDLSMFRLRMS